jgi:hypothetical protein
MQPYAVNWAIDDNAATGSDHAVIRFNVVSDEDFCEDLATTTRYNWEKADWEKFQDTLLSQTKDSKVQWDIVMEHAHHKENLETAAIFLRDSITYAAEASVPKLRPSPRSKRWWTKELTEAHATLKKSYKQWKRQKDRTTQEKFKESRNVYFRTIRNAKLECWKKYLAEAQEQEIFQALKYINQRRVQRTPVLQHEGTEYM